jgi:hypothetical protein
MYHPAAKGTLPRQLLCLRVGSFGTFANGQRREFHRCCECIRQMPRLLHTLEANIRLKSRGMAEYYIWRLYDTLRYLSPCGWGCQPVTRPPHPRTPRPPRRFHPLSQCSEAVPRSWGVCNRVCVFSYLRKQEVRKAAHLWRVGKHPPNRVEDAIDAQSGDRQRQEQQAKRERGFNPLPPWSRLLPVDVHSVPDAHPISSEFSSHCTLIHLLRFWMGPPFIQSL